MDFSVHFTVSFNSLLWEGKALNRDWGMGQKTRLTSNTGDRISKSEKFCQKYWF